MNIEINIGLLTNTGLAISATNAGRRLCEFLPQLVVGNLDVRESSTERTLIVEGTIEHISFADLEGAIYVLAGLLWQDAIAFRIDGKHGYLVGPNAEAWGDFDPAEFLTI